MKNLYTKEIV